VLRRQFLIGVVSVAAAAAVPATASARRGGSSFRLRSGGSRDNQFAFLMALTVGTTAGLVAIGALIYWVVARVGKERPADGPSWPQRSVPVTPVAAGPEPSQRSQPARPLAFGKRAR